MKAINFAGLTIVLAVAIGAWILASPIGSDPDGNFHLASIWCGDGLSAGKCETRRNEFPEPSPDAVFVPRLIAIANGCGPGNPGISASCTNELAADPSMSETTFSNVNGLYPRGFYWVHSHLVSKDIVNSVLLMRALNVLILVVLLLLANYLLPKEISNGVNLSFLLITLPMGLFLIASNNPSSWAITGTGCTWAFLYGFLISQDRSKTITLGIASVLSTLVASQSRADAAAFVVLTCLVAVLIAYSRKPNLRRQISVRSALTLSLSVLSLVSFVNTEQGNAVRTGFAEGNFGRDASLTFLWNLTKLPSLLAGIFGYSGGGGGLGWLDVVMPEIVTLGMIAVLSGTVAISLSKRKRLESWTLSLFVLTSISIPIYVLYNDRAIIGENFQSRYVLPLIVALFGVIFSVPSTEVICRTDTFRRFISIALPVIYLVAMHTTIRRYVTGNDVMDWNLNKGREWWWNGYPAPLVVLFAGTLAFAVATRLALRNLSPKNNMTA